MAAEAPAPAAAPAPPPEADTPAAAVTATDGEPAAATDDAGAAEAAPAEGEQPAELDTPTETPEQAPALFRRVLKEREKVIALTQKLEQGKQRLETERASLARERQEFAARQAEVTRILEREERIKKDPYAYFEEFEVNPSDFGRRLMNENDPISKQLAEERRERLALQEQIKKDKEAQAAAEMHTRVVRAKQNFIGFVTQRAAEFPDVAVEDDAEVAEHFWALATEHHRQTGDIPPFEAVARHMQKQIDAQRAKREERRRQRLGAGQTANPSAGTSAPPRTAPTGLPAKGPGPRAPTTLSNRDASVASHTPPKGATPEEIDEWSRLELRRALRKDADS